MPAYFVVELEIANQTAMEPYRAAVPATIAQYGGRFLTRGGATELVEGGPEPKRIVILEFPDAAAVKRWYNSPEYQKILPGRLEKLDRPRLYRRRRELAGRIGQSESLSMSLKELQPPAPEHTRHIGEGSASGIVGLVRVM